MVRPRRQRLSGGNDENEDEMNASFVPPVSMSQENLTTLLAALQQSQADICHRLIQEVRSSTPLDSATLTVASTSAGANFSQCQAKFSGTPSESVENFIDAVEIFKSCIGIEDANAIRGLSLLLSHEAATWWQGVKNHVNDWQDAVNKLRSAFGERRPPFQLYKDLYSMTQGTQNTDLFVAQARALLAKIPEGDITEKAKLDMVYGLLDIRIRKRIQRDNINSFEDLLRHARSVEDSMKECRPTGSTPRASPGVAQLRWSHQAPPLPQAGASAGVAACPAYTQQRPFPTQAASQPPLPRATASAAAAPQAVQGSRSGDTGTSTAKRMYCSYCKKYTNHSKIDCQRLKAKNDNSVSALLQQPQPIACYGCGEIGVVRANCAKCNNKASVNAFYAFDTPNETSSAQGCTQSQRSFLKSVSQCVPTKQNIATTNSNYMCDYYDKSISTNNFQIPKQSKYINKQLQNNSKSSLQVSENKNKTFTNNTNCKNDNKDTYSVRGSYSVQFCENLNCSNDNNHRCYSDPFYIEKQNCFKNCSNNNNESMCLYEPGLNSSNIVQETAEYFVPYFIDPESDSFSVDIVKKVDKYVVPSVIDQEFDSNFINDNFSCNEVTYQGEPEPTTCNVSAAPDTSACCVKGESVSLLCVPPLAGPRSDHHRRPLLNIEILGANGTALVDSAAMGCIAGHSLYAFLQEQGYPLHCSARNVKLADGTIKLMDVLSAVVEVKLLHKVLSVTFLIFPEARNNESLLGIDFLNKANLVFDFGSSLWYFSEKDNIKYELQYETSVNPSHEMHDCVVEHDSLSQLLAEFDDVFRESGEATPFAEHRIDTGDHPPIAVPPYRVTPARKQAMKKELDKMLAEDIIEECESAWAAPALLVPKKKGGFRFCVDYRKLNNITKSDTYPMPLIDELLQATKQGCVMSTLDLGSGYWQVQVEADSDKTSFTTPFGTFRFKRMPFGLKNAPATFQRLIDRFRTSSSLKDVVLLGYMDDLLVISENPEKHLLDLRAVFERLRFFKLRANREKCVFARDSVKYLGHVITPEGISPDDEKIEAILNMKTPSNLKHLRSFLQTCSWFRKFIPGFSQISEPLTKLTRKNQPWQWNAEQDRAFMQLKRLLTSAPILIQADYSKPFILRTDASNYALGAVLLQGEKNNEKPIEYASRLLTSAERNYSTTEREALAVVWAVERFRGYIEGHPVIVGTDHQPLKWLLTVKSPSGRLVRWALKLQAFDLHFEYTPGKINLVADTLSRPNCDEETLDACGICSVIIDLPARNPSEIRQAQLADPDLEKIIKDLEDGEEVNAHRWTGRGYIMETGVLYRYNPDSDSEEPQLAVPVDMREEIMKECHDAPLAGHPGVERTYQKVAQRFFFPGMRRFITDYIKTCTSCQRYKATNEKPPGLLQTPILNQRNEVLAIDLFGPLPPGENGERWILLVTDTATRWVELYALRDATAEACARTLIEEHFLRYGLPRRIISDNGVQFVSAVMQQCMFILDIKQELLPLFHPEGNPAERKNRDLKVLLSQLVGMEHNSWPTHLPSVRFAMNSAKCQTTGVTPAYLTFARELRSPLEVRNDPRAILEKENIVPQITPHLKKFLGILASIRDKVELQQDKRKDFADQSRRVGEQYDVGDQVLLNTHVLSNAAKGVSSKFVPKRDGPYVVTKKVSPTTYLISLLDGSRQLGKFHAKQLTRYHGRDETPPDPVVPKLNRGRPRLVKPVRVPDHGESSSVDVPVHEQGRFHELEGEYIANKAHRLPLRTSRGTIPARYRS